MTNNKFTNEDLTIFYVTDGEKNAVTKMPHDILKSFSLESTTDFERGIYYPLLNYGDSVDTHNLDDEAKNHWISQARKYNFNQIEIVEDLLSLRYIINFYDATVQPLMKLIKREIYPMNQFSLKIEVADYDTKPQYAKDYENEYCNNNTNNKEEDKIYTRGGRKV